MTLRDFRTITTHDGHWHSATIRQNGTDIYVHDRAGFWAMPVDGKHLVPVNPQADHMLRAAVERNHPWANARG